MTAITRPEADYLKQLDESKVTGFHWLVMFTSGMGFFTDAYDLFIIGVAMTLIKTEWNLSTLEISLIGSTSLLAAGFGALVFGRIADLLGRKRIYGYEILVLAAGAIASGFAPNIWWLIVFRFILGLGIGGDYPVSATIMSEFSGTKDRGRMISLVFSMQGLGLVCGPLVALALLASGISHDLAWRIMLAFGAIPALSVFYLRRQIHETPRYAMLAGDDDELTAGIGRVAGTHAGAAGPETAKPPKHGETAFSAFRTYSKHPQLWRWLIGSSLAWMILDIAYYGNTISTPLVLRAINPQSNLIGDTQLLLAIFAVFALPGYVIAAFTMDRLGRKAIQTIGFAMMALFFLAIAFLHSGAGVAPFLMAYGMTYFFFEFGPNTTTFIYPAEIFPVRVRTTSHGIAAFSGKIGAFIGTFSFPLLLGSIGLAGTVLICAIISGAGFLITAALLPEPKGRSLEEISSDDVTAPVGLRTATAQA